MQLNFSSFLFLTVLCFGINSCKNKETYKKIDDRTKGGLSTDIIPDNHFLGDAKCKECHKNEFNDWQGSHHEKAMQIADSSTVLGNFKNRTFISQGVTSKFYKKDGAFYVNTEGPDGKNHDYKIIYTFGITPLQQYIVQFPNGHYQCLRTAWDSEKNLWFDLYPNFKVVHSEWLHWSRGGLNWNNMCADCHSTNVRKNYDYTNHSYNTKYALINVSCEACHGPGKQHVTNVEKMGKDYVANGNFKMTSNTAPKELVDQCARCHMRREQFSKHFNFEGTLLDHYFPQLLEERLYEPDGQILDEVYVYGSFLQSKMYQNDVTCTNCHNPHSLQLKISGNALCTQCHVKEEYDTPKHHHHPENTPSSKCINCHMTGKYYMGNDFRRDHSFRIPRPDLSVKYGSRNACTECHKDKNNDWAAAKFKTMYKPIDSLHYAEQLAAGLTRQPNAHLGLINLIKSEHQPDIVRASAIKALDNYNVENFINEFNTFLNDDSALVRGAAVDVLGLLNTKDYTAYFLPLLNDAKRSVRIKAFYGLASLDTTLLPEQYKDSYTKVAKEFWTHINANSDFVGVRVKKGDYYVKKGNYDKAIENYESALKIDTLNNQLRINLATFYYNTKQFKKAENSYKEVIKLEPKFGPTYYSLALLYAELNRVDEAIEQLVQAKKIMPKNVRVYYNLALLYDKKQAYKKAENTVVSGLKIDHENESLLYVLAYIYTKSNQKGKAKNIAKRLVDLYPNNTQYLNFYNQL